MRRFIAFLAACAVMVAPSLLLAHPASAQADWGDCWRPTNSPYMCFADNGAGSWNFYINDEMASGVRPGNHHTDIQLAFQSWNNKRIAEGAIPKGPYSFSYSHQTGEHAINVIPINVQSGSTEIAISFCFTNGTCGSNPTLPLLKVDHVNAYVNAADGFGVGEFDDNGQVRIYEQALGGSLGLLTSADTGSVAVPGDAMYTPTGGLPLTGASTVISANDYGTQAPCHGDPSNADSLNSSGVVCIFGWT